MLHTEDQNPKGLSETIISIANLSKDASLQNTPKILSSGTANADGLGKLLCDTAEKSIGRKSIKRLTGMCT